MRQHLNINHVFESYQELEKTQKVNNIFLTLPIFKFQLLKKETYLIDHKRNMICNPPTNSWRIWWIFVKYREGNHINEKWLTTMLTVSLTQQNVVMLKYLLNKRVYDRMNLLLWFTWLFLPRKTQKSIDLSILHSLKSNPVFVLHLLVYHIDKFEQRVIAVEYVAICTDKTQFLCLIPQLLVIIYPQTIERGSYHIRQHCRRKVTLLTC